MTDQLELDIRNDRGEYRTTFTAMLDSDEWYALTADARQVFYTMKNSRVCHVSGIFLFDDGELATVSKQAGIPSRRVLDGIADLIEKGWAIQDKPILWLRNALRFETRINLKNRNHLTFIMKHVRGLRKRPIVAKFCHYYGLEVPAGFPPEAIPDSIPDGIGDGIKEPIGNPTTTTTSTTTTTATTTSSSSGKKPDDGIPDSISDGIPYKTIIEDLNQRAGRNFAYAGDKGRATRDLIKARWNEKYTLEDFLKVNQVKCDEWANTQQEIFLRPETLYCRKHFQSYLNQGTSGHGSDPAQTYRGLRAPHP